MSDAPRPSDKLEPGLMAEIEAALGDMSVEDMLEFSGPERGSGPAGRETRSGTVMSVRDGEVMVEFGPKSQGVCPIGHFESVPKVGERYDFQVDRYDERAGMLQLSRRGAVRKAEWEQLEVGQVIEGRVTGTNKGGLDVEVANHRAFMPAGQVDLRHIDDLGVFVGEKMTCEVIELDRNRGRIVLSRRSVMETERAEAAEELMDQLEPGTVHTATIRSIKPFGAFADLGGLDGLIHVSDLSWSRVNDPKEVVKEGQEVRVIILKLEPRGDGPPRIGLGMKQLEDDPYQAQASAIEEGAEVSGRVTKTTAFGAFVELAPGVEGLIHISELAHERVNRVESVVKPDQVVTVKVLSVDPGARRISLSLKAMRQKAEAGAPRAADPAMRKLMAKFGTDGKDLKGGLG